MKKTERQSNIELLRIILILMIITHHVIAHGLGLLTIKSPNYVVGKFTYYELAINCFLMYSINTFVFISGYFGMKFKLRTVVSIFLQAFFYSVVLYILYSCFYPSQWSIKKLFESFFPISRGEWWFISTYLGLYFISPFLNKGVAETDRGQLKILLVGLLFFNSFAGFLFGTLSSENGGSIFNFIVVYVLGRYMNKYSIELKGARFFLLFFTLILFCATIVLIHFNMSNKIWQLFYFNNPLMIVCGIFLFFIFKKMTIKNNKLINLVASAVLGIYMIHDYHLVREALARFVAQIKISYVGYLFAIYIILIIFAVFTISAIIEIARKIIFDKLIDKLIVFLKSSKRILRWRIYFFTIYEKLSIR